LKYQLALAGEYDFIGHKAGVGDDLLAARQAAWPICSQNKARAGKSHVMPISRTVSNPISRKTPVRVCWMSARYMCRPISSQSRALSLPPSHTRSELSSLCGTQPRVAAGSGPLT
jgi:hypothetical protein